MFNQQSSGTPPPPPATMPPPPAIEAPQAAAAASGSPKTLSLTPGMIMSIEAQQGKKPEKLPELKELPMTIGEGAQLASRASAASNVGH